MSFKGWCAAIRKEFIMEMPQTLLPDDSVDMNELFILIWNKQKFSSAKNKKKGRKYLLNLCSQTFAFL